MQRQSEVVSWVKWGSVLALAMVCSACAQAPTETAMWNKSYEGMVSVSRVPSLGPSAGIF
jgi:hypothetical protein